MDRSPVRTLPRDPRRSPGFAALLSAILPGLGQMYGSRWRRGLVMLALPFVGLGLLALAALVLGPVAEAVVRRAALVALLVLGALYAFHLVVVADAFAVRSGGRLERRHVVDLALLVAIVLGLSLGYYAVYRHSTVWAGLLTSVFEPPQGVTVGPGTTTADTAAPAWTGHDRLNVLLLGIDDDDNTDTMIVLSLDPVSHSAVMLSIPRDTVVDIPGVGRDKVNSIWLHAGPRRAPALARETVSDFLGIPIQSYVLVNYDAFRETVNGVGGVLIDVPQQIVDEAYPIANAGVVRLEFLAGPQVMNGDRALRYARTRHADNDFHRAERQQLVIFAVRERLAQEGVFALPPLIARVAPLVKTDFDPANAFPLARAAIGISKKDIRHEVLLPCDDPTATHCELTEDNSPHGYYLIPDLAKVRAFAAQLFGATTSSTP